MSTSSWLAHRALIAPSSVKRHKPSDIPSVDVKYDLIDVNKHQTYNPSDNYDPRYPNDYDKVVKLQSAKPCILPTVIETTTRVTSTCQPKLSGDEMLKRRLEAMEAREVMEDTAVEEEKKPIGVKLLTKMGWKEGEGLGKNRQGITAPLIVKNITNKTGIIVKAQNLQKKTSVKQAEISQSEPVKLPPDTERSRIIMLSLSIHEVSDMDELEEVTSQYGSLINIKITNINDYNLKCNLDPVDVNGDHLRILCEYETKEQATRAYLGLNGTNLLDSTVTVSYLEEHVYNLFPN